MALRIKPDTKRNKRENEKWVCLLSVFWFSTYFFERCYVYNIFTINYGWLVIISLNLNLALSLLF